MITPFGVDSSPTALRVVPACALALSLLGCSHVPYRSMRYGDVNATCQAAFAKSPGKAADDAERACWNSSYEYTDSYDLLVAEFDDQGWIPPGTDSNELTDLFARLDKISAAHCGDVSVVVFVHGWHHNAAPLDSNVADFRKLLTTFAASERNGELTSSPCTARPQSTKGRHVVGIYVGWAGESINLPGIRYLTVEDRKLTAEKVAQGSVRELFARLTLKREKERGDGQNRLGMRMVSIGHSFGGLILFESLQQAMIKDGLELDAHGFAKREGDLVVLINQAFEATRYEALRQSIASYKFRDDQFPSLISVTSSGDIWTGKIGEVGRGLSTLLEKKESDVEQRANITTVGHNDRYITHELHVCTPGPSETCAPTFCAAKQIKAPSPFRGFGGETEICELRLKARDDFVSHHSPYWIVQTDDEIIKGHDGWLLDNGHFEHFLQEMYARINTRHIETPPAPSGSQ